MTATAFSPNHPLILGNHPMNSPTYTVPERSPCAHRPNDTRFCPPAFPKADRSAARYIELIEQGVIPCPCSQQDTPQQRRPTQA